MSELEDFIPTKGSVCNEQAVKNYKVSTFESYKPKEGKVSEAKIVSKTGVPRSEINMNKAKHEIIKFGMSGFDPTKKEEAKIQLAIKLGAKPPKNKYKNYKELLQEKKLEKERIKSNTVLSQLGKNSQGKSTAKGKSFDKKRKKKKEGLLDVYGNVRAKKV